MNWAQGLFRVWLVASVVWIGGVIVAEWREQRFIDKLYESQWGDAANITTLNAQITALS